MEEDLARRQLWWDAYQLKEIIIKRSFSNTKALRFSFARSGHHLRLV